MASLLLLLSPPPPCHIEYLSSLTLPYPPLPSILLLSPSPWNLFHNLYKKGRKWNKMKEIASLLFLSFNVFISEEENTLFIRYFVSIVNIQAYFPLSHFLTPVPSNLILIPNFNSNSNTNSNATINLHSNTNNNSSSTNINSNSNTNSNSNSNLNSNSNSNSNSKFQF